MQTRVPGITLRPMTDADLPFLERLYGTTREAELARTGWTDEEKASFIRFQFEAQHAHYTKHYAAADFLVIERAGQPIGRLYLDWRKDELRIVDIALMPEARGDGLGTGLLTELQDRARERNVAVSIHVEQMNPAMTLYRRLGFQKVDEHGVYDLMEWRA